MAAWHLSSLCGAAWRPRAKQGTLHPEQAPLTDGCHKLSLRAGQRSLEDKPRRLPGHCLPTGAAVRPPGPAHYVNRGAGGCPGSDGRDSSSQEPGRGRPGRDRPKWQMCQQGRGRPKRRAPRAADTNPRPSKGESLPVSGSGKKPEQKYRQPHALSFLLRGPHTSRLLRFSKSLQAVRQPGAGCRPRPPPSESQTPSSPGSQTCWVLPLPGPEGPLSPPPIPSHCVEPGSSCLCPGRPPTTPCVPRLPSPSVLTPQWNYAPHRGKPPPPEMVCPRMPYLCVSGI